MKAKRVNLKEAQGTPLKDTRLGLLSIYIVKAISVMLGKGHLSQADRCHITIR